ncbi:hypothetical protein [Ligilactobacillus sp. LYQ60]|uniref:hypothetical protein n=1 Tax=Ligilactobacillus sp. LYQ60 TaxID=3378799 RepID=UPI003855185D
MFYQSDMEDSGKYALKRTGITLLFAEEVHKSEGLRKSLELTALKTVVDGAIDFGVDSFFSAFDEFLGPVETIARIYISSKLDDKINKVIDRYVG